MGSAVMWFRRDLRLADNPALLDAVSAGDGQVLGLFVLDPALWDMAGDPRRTSGGVTAQPVRRRWAAISSYGVAIRRRS